MDKPTRYYMHALVLDTATDVLFEFNLYAPSIAKARAAVADLMRPYASSGGSGVIYHDRVLKVWVGYQPYLQGNYVFQPGITAEMCNPPPSAEWELLHGTSG